MATVLPIPADLEQAFRQFSRDFVRVTAQWVELGEESPETVAMHRAGLREYLGIADDPDAYGVSRTQRLCDVFAFWRALALAMPWKAPGTAVVPVLGDDAEVRLADRWWSNG